MGACGYSKNYYDVRAGVEDTNNSVLNFNKITADNDRSLAAPSKLYITGHSMDGHITGAAIGGRGLHHRQAQGQVRRHGADVRCDGRHRMRPTAAPTPSTPAARTTAPPRWTPGPSCLPARRPERGPGLA